MHDDGRRVLEVRWHSAMPGLSGQADAGGCSGHMMFTPGAESGTDVVAEFPVDDLVARDTARRLATEEGIFVGLSSGATLAAALNVAAEAAPGSTILAMLPDTGERYLSTILFEGVADGSDDEWLASLGQAQAA